MRFDWWIVFLCLFSAQLLAQEDGGFGDEFSDELSQEEMSPRESTTELVIPIPMTQHYLIRGPWENPPNYNIPYYRVRERGYYYNPPRTPYGP